MRKNLYCDKRDEKREKRMSIHHANEYNGKKLKVVTLFVDLRYVDEEKKSLIKMLVEDRNNNYARVMEQQCVYIVALRNLDN